MSDDLVNWHYDKFKEGPEDFDDLHDKAVAEIDRLKAELEDAKKEAVAWANEGVSLERQLASARQEAATTILELFRDYMDWASDSTTYDAFQDDVKAKFKLEG